jgi:transposase InsO family protein
MDFMSDALADGRRFRLLNVVVDWTRECLAIEVGRSLTGRNVIAVLEKIAMRRGCPTAIVSDNDPEFCSRASTNGRIDLVSSCSSSGQASRLRMRSSNASTASAAMNA